MVQLSTIRSSQLIINISFHFVLILLSMDTRIPLSLKKLILSQSARTTHTALVSSSKSERSRNQASRISTSTRQEYSRLSTSHPSTQLTVVQPDTRFILMLLRYIHPLLSLMKDVIGRSKFISRSSRRIRRPRNLANQIRRRRTLLRR